MSAQVAPDKPTVELKPAPKFQEKVEAWRKSLVASKELAQECAVMALTHCYDNGTASQLRAVLGIIEKEGKDFIRRAPYTIWLREFAPVKMVTKTDDEGKTSKVLEYDSASPLVANAAENIAKATAKLWWTMSKDKEASAFDVIRFDARVVGLANQALKLIEEQDGEVNATDIAHVKKTRDTFKARVEAAKALQA